MMSRATFQPGKPDSSEVADGETAPSPWWARPGLVKLVVGTLGLCITAIGAALVYPPAGLIVLGGGMVAATVDWPQRSAYGMARFNHGRPGDDGPVADQ
jgi:hypothetical protein